MQEFEVNASLSPSPEPRKRSVNFEVASQLFSNFDWKDIHTIAEFGAGEISSIVLQKWALNNAIYRAMDWTRREPATKPEFPEAKNRFTFSSLPPSCEFPLPDQSQNLLLCCYSLEALRMDQFYMVCSEARRVVKTGSHWGIVNYTFGSSLPSAALSKVWEKLHDWKRAWTGNTRPMEIMHYISPEDWEVESTKVVDRGLFSHQITVLKRLP